MALVSIVNTYRRGPLVGVGAEILVLLALLPRGRVLRMVPALLALCAVVSTRLPDTWWVRMATILNESRGDDPVQAIVLRKAGYIYDGSELKLTGESEQVFDVRQ